ncbi:SIMPL domain-containing protein [uncultured Roseobacter sp.]|uniref:SIMPL domain-containing protein n=1 Tax=uncultured Roseobacter sp. TaxID=114847 RepID=UPI0026038CCC|nr:SIMPL domain-containing protein [uncultured Roseobacter sp.]
MRFFRTVAMVVGIGAAASAAADTGRMIVTSGTSTVEQAPDMAVIEMGVTQQAPDAGDALDATSAALRAVLDSLSGVGIEARDIATSHISLQPVWSNRIPGEEDAPRITGFQASNTLSVRIRNLALLGDVMGVAVGDGANRFNGVRFAFQDPEPLNDRARAAAVRDAMRRAAQLAEASGVALGPVQSITERSGGRPAPMMEMAAASRASGVPVAAGEMSVSVTVDMVFQIAE